jgi:thiamine biosynthesis lipoprotein ApbE
MNPADFHAGGKVLVAHPHPRTQQRGLLPAIACAVLASGRVVLHLHIEGKRYRVITDPSNVRPA